MESSTQNFIDPVQAIKSPMNMQTWNTSEAYRDLLGFILTVGESIKGIKSSDECHVSEPIEKLVTMLNTFEGWIDEIPPIDQPQRFGNKAFRTWSRKLFDHSDDLIITLLSEECKEAVIELKVYLHDSFGNATRIDYGTGHEISFVYFLLCLYKLKLFTANDHIAIVNKVFQKYLTLLRKLQTTYRMEPAGSQGVWGLDDFQFIPYIWGSAQLQNQSDIIPDEIPVKEKAELYSSEYLFFDCVKYINSVKTGLFAEHSNILWNISSVQLWSKVHTGLIKMYKAEVLSKFPIIQHLRFGTLISAKKAGS